MLRSLGIVSRMLTTPADGSRRGPGAPAGGTRGRERARQQGEAEADHLATVDHRTSLRSVAHGATLPTKAGEWQLGPDPAGWAFAPPQPERSAGRRTL